MTARGSAAVRLTLVAAAAVLGLAPLPAPAIERWYSHGVYPPLQRVLTGLSSLTSIALLDIAAAAMLLGVVARYRRLLRRDGVWTTVRGLPVALVVAASVLYLWFVLFWGLNYRRVPLEEKLAYDPAQLTRSRGVEFGRFAVEAANAARISAGASDDGGGALEEAFADVERRLGRSSPTRLAPSKRSLAGWYFRMAAIDGMTNPFFLEIVVNPDLLPFERPFVLAHEWAHLAGYADESEANFIAWLTCIRASPGARYSGWLSAYELVSGSLPREDQRALAALIAPAVQQDLAAARQRLARSSPDVRAAANRAYDSYLRANRIVEGLANYSAAVRLMLGAEFEPDWVPRLRAR